MKQIVCALMVFCALSDLFSDDKCALHKRDLSLQRSPPSIAAYNAPARIESKPGNVYAELQFNYWQASQDNMEMGQFDHGKQIHITSTGGDLSTITSISSSDSLKYINMDFDFDPGFTVGIGYKFNVDEWDLRLRYTWFHNSNETSFSAPAFTIFSSGTPNVFPTWGTFVNASLVNSNAIDSYLIESYASVSEDWHLSMDLVDLDLSRRYFVGRKWIVCPSFGARLALIKQNVQVSYNNGFVRFPSSDVLVTNSFLADNKVVSCLSDSWGTGLKASIEVDWIVGSGFKFFGIGETDVLFTKYYSLQEATTTSGSVLYTVISEMSFPLTDNTQGVQPQINCLRTHLDLEFGLSWGIDIDDLYFNCDAGYEFQVFLDQNMFRRNIEDSGSFIPNGNLYIQGLTAAIQLDF